MPGDHGPFGILENNRPYRVIRKFYGSFCEFSNFSVLFVIMETFG